MSSVYGCFDRQPFAQVYYATGGRMPIRHVTSRECQYTKSDLGQADPGCVGCKHRLETTNEPPSGDSIADLGRCPGEHDGNT